MKDLWNYLSHPLRLLFSKNRDEAEADLDEEIRAHLEMEVEDNIQAGMSPKEARYAAYRTFGSVASSKERTRDVWGMGSLERFWQDVRYGARMLAKKRLVTAVAILSLGIGIGVNTAVFTVMKAVVFYAPPLYQDVDRLVAIWETPPHEPATRRHVCPESYLAYKGQDELFESVAAVQPLVDASVRFQDRPEQVGMQVASANLLTTLGVQPLLGRDFLPEDEEAASENVVLVSYRLWQSRLGRDPDIVGETIFIDSHSHTIVGVLPRGFWYANVFTDLWVPDRLSTAASIENEVNLRIVGKLLPGTSEEEARTRLEALVPGLEQNDPSREKGRGLRIDPVRGLDALGGEIPPGFLQLFWALGLLLLLASTNIANVMVARGTARQKEIVIRSALGAGRFRLVRQLLTESLLLACLGGAVGLLLTLWAIHLLTHYAPGDLAWTLDIRMDTWVFAFALLVSIATGLLAGLAPALADSRVDVNEGLKEGGEGHPVGGGRQRLRGAIVVAEVALTLILLAGVGLLIKGFVTIHNSDPGFEASGLITFQVELAESRYGRGSEAGLDSDALFDEIQSRLGEIPGVTSASAASSLPPYAGNPQPFFIGNRGRQEGDREPPMAAYNMVLPDYMATMKVPLLSGRPITRGDSGTAPGVVVINESMVKRYWPDTDAIGEKIYLASDRTARPHTIVGIAADMRNQGMVLDALPEMLVPYGQRSTASLTGLNAAPLRMMFLMRMNGRSADLAAAVRDAVSKVDPELAISDLSTMTDRIDAGAQEVLLGAFLNGPIIGMALLLTAVGIYGIQSFSVSRRLREFGIRIALGAGRARLLKLVFGQGFRLLAVGIIGGAAGALALNRVLSSLLSGVVSMDPWILLGASALLVAVAAVASFIPARRASKVDPVIALRYE